jgi:ankyrin repeat protein
MQIPELIHMVFNYLSPADLLSCSLSDRFMSSIAKEHLRKHAAKDHQGLTALSWASKRGHDTLVKYLIEQDHDLEKRSGFRLQVDPHGSDDVNPTDGMTAIHFAAAYGHQNIVEMLVEAGANPNVIGNRQLEVPPGTIPCHTTAVGCTPFHAAAANGHSRVVKLFLDLKFPVDSLGGYNTGDGVALPAPQRCTPLHCAVGGGHFYTAKLLLDAGANPNADTNSGDLNDPNFETSIRPLHLAAWGGHVGITKLLCKRAKYKKSFVNFYGSCNSMEHYKFRALDLALERRDSKRHKKVALFLKSKGALRKAYPSRRDIHQRGGIAYSLSRRLWWPIE